MFRRPSADTVEKKRRFPGLRSRNPEGLAANKVPGDDTPSESGGGVSLYPSGSISERGDGHRSNTHSELGQSTPQIASNTRSPPSFSSVPGDILSTDGATPSFLRTPRVSVGHVEHEGGLPSYASATNPSTITIYRFVRCSPFAMVLSPDNDDIESHGLYHVSVGVNVWMPSCTVTTIRRGTSEHGPVVAQLELGVMSTPASITMGHQCKPIQQVMYRKSVTSSSRLYYLDNGQAIKWKLNSEFWQAHLGSTLLATFYPIPPRKLALHPAGHRMSDHIMVALVILMREHLTPLAGMRGDAAQLFNYSPHHYYRED